jgi:sterol desaturase/sphingolipid hydroxylase (fatty acid hydroxylase superfamily)
MRATPIALENPISGDTLEIHDPAGDELEMAMKVRRVGDASRSLLRTLSKSRANYWASYVVDFSCIVLFAYLGLRRQPSLSSMVGSFLLGVAVFTLVEYCIHRWLLHDPRSILYQAHEAHHIDPGHVAAFLFPASFAVLMPIWLLLTGVLHLYGASFFLCGFSVGYFYYGALHHFEHTTRINQIPFRWLQKRWADHSVHHRLEHRNFGVMTSFWDYVFGTHQKQAKRKSLAA